MEDGNRQPEKPPPKWQFAILVFCVAFMFLLLSVLLVGAVARIIETRHRLGR